MLLNAVICSTTFFLHDEMFKLFCSKVFRMFFFNFFIVDVLLCHPFMGLGSMENIHYSKSCYINLFKNTFLYQILKTHALIFSQEVKVFGFGAPTLFS